MFFMPTSRMFIISLVIISLVIISLTHFPMSSFDSPPDCPRIVSRFPFPLSFPNDLRKLFFSPVISDVLRNLFFPLSFRTK